VRIDYLSAFPMARTALAGLEKAVEASDLDPKLLDVVNTGPHRTRRGGSFEPAEIVALTLGIAAVNAGIE
jgi:hypothetical protein